MKVSIFHSETLEYYDFPMLFVGRDSIGGLYLCLAVEEVDRLPQYIAIAISPEKLQMLKARKIDLHSTFAQPELGTWFRLTSIDETQAIGEPIIGITALPEAMLPKPGAYLPQQSIMLPETFEAVKLSAIAKEAGMNPTLLRQYVSGTKRPSTEQAKRVQDALHRVGQRLLEVRLI